MMIIGVSGTPGAGKDEVASILKRMKFDHISLSDILREQLKNNKKEVSRFNLMGLGQHMRLEHGDGVLAALALERVRNKNTVITSIGSVGEVELLSQHPEFFFVFVDAPMRLRFKRFTSRPRNEHDPKTFEEFKRFDRYEFTGGKNGKFRNFGAPKKRARLVVLNTGSLQDLERKVSQLVVECSDKL